MSDKVERKRLWLLAGLGAGGIGFALFPNGAKKHADETSSILSVDIEQESKPLSEDDIDEGYLLTLDENNIVIDAGWGIDPGEILGVALSITGEEEIVRSIPIHDINGSIVAEIADVRLSKQTYGNDEPWLRGAGFRVNATYRIPYDLPSGVYFVCGKAELFFVVRRNNDITEGVIEGAKRLTVLISTNTFNAYSKTLGRSMYGPKVVPSTSFERPMTGVKSKEWVPLLKWMHESEAYGRDVVVNYIIDIDMEHKAVLDQTDLLLVVGHSEYWTRSARESFDYYVGNGGNSILASGNTMWWQSRYEGDRQELLVSYKSAARREDPKTGTPDETASWYESRLNYSIVGSIGSNFKHGGFGATRRSDALGWDGCAIANSTSPLLSNTGLKRGEYFELFHVAEYDGVPILGFDEDGVPVPDLDSIDAHKFELIGFDMGYRGGHTVGTWHILKKTPESGTIFNIGAMPIARIIRRAIIKPERWTAGADILKQILRNSLAQLIDDKNVFSDTVIRKPVKWPAKTPFKGDFPDDFIWKNGKPKLFQNLSH